MGKRERDVAPWEENGDGGSNEKKKGNRKTEWDKESVFGEGRKRTKVSEKRQRDLRNSTLEGRKKQSRGMRTGRWKEKRENTSPRTSENEKRSFRK